MVRGVLVTESYGRLLNEGPYATLDFKYDMVEQSSSDEPYTALFARIEGGSIGNSDSGNGNLSNLRLSQTYIVAGNVLLPDVRWQVGTLDTYFGDLGLYDMRPAQTLRNGGRFARYQTERFELLLGGGDLWICHAQQLQHHLHRWWNDLLPTGVNGLELGAGGQYRYEPGVKGNRNAAYASPNVDYADFYVAKLSSKSAQDYPNQTIEFPDPELRDAHSYKAIGYLGFGGFGPFIWNILCVLGASPSGKLSHRVFTKGRMSIFTALI